MSAGMIYKYCPICRSKLEKSDGCYLCTNSECKVVILDNHIFDIVELHRELGFDNQSEGTVAGENTEDVHTVEEHTKEEHKRLQVVVMNKAMIESYATQKHDKSSIVISIASIGTSHAFVLANSVAKILKVLQVEFNDTDIDDKVSGCISYADARKIADFVVDNKDIKDLDIIIVQCEAGQSRSAGVAGAILKCLYDDDTSIFNNKYYKPNMLCYRRVLTALTGRGV